MRIAVYGGSFNPPHVGHGMVVSWLRWTNLVDAVWLVPVYRHAFEGVHDKTLASFEERLGWCEAFAQDIGQGVAVCAVEAELPTPSYTIDTLRFLADRHPEHHFRLVVGADAIPHLPKWRDWEGISSAFAPVIVGREGYEGPDDSVAFPDVSSTEIRRRLKTGEPIGHLVTARVGRLLAKSAWLDAAPLSPRSPEA